MVSKGMVPKGEICQSFKTNQSIAKQCHNVFKPSHVLDGKYQQEKSEDTKWAIRRRTSKKDEQC